MIDLINWINNTRQPSLNSRLLVEIGPGTFGAFTDAQYCFITLKGSGRQHTIIEKNPDGAYAMSFGPNCNLDVESLTVKSIGGLGAINLGSSNGVDGGITTWSDVEVLSTAYGWTESGCSISKHYWFNSRIVTRVGAGIARAYSTCSENWFLGSEISAIADRNNVNEAFAFGLNGSETHVYGSVIRAVAEAGATLQSAALGLAGKNVKGLLAISVGTGAEIHIHGTGIDAISVEPNNIAVLGVHPGAMIHANESAYNLRTGTGGIITRILNPNGQGHVHAPYLWEHIPDAPLVSITGADVTTETVGADINMLVYNSQCTGSGGPWYNVALRTCR